MSSASSGEVSRPPLSARDIDTGEGQSSIDASNRSGRPEDEIAGVAPPKRRRRLLIVGIMSVLLAGGAGAAFFLQHGEMKTATPVGAASNPVVRAVIVAPAIDGTASYTGVIHARYESNLGFRVPGKILTRLVDPGAHVKSGQPLMRLDDLDLSLALRAARSSVDAAKATAVQTASDQKRRQALVGQGWVSQQAYELNKSAAGSAAAQLASATSQEYEAENQLSYAILRADSDGVVTRVPGEPGQVVGAAQPVVQLAHDGSREAEVYLPEGEERNATDPATATLYAFSGTSYPAKLRELSASADPATRTYKARYVLGGDGRDAPLGSTVTISLSQPQKSILKVPIGAVFDDGHGPSVWIIDPSSHIITRRAITIAALGEEQAKIKSGLSGGEIVVSLGAQLLRDGDRVTIDAGPLDTSVPKATVPFESAQ